MGSVIRLMQVPTCVNHQIDFKSLSEQEQYFDKHVIRVFDNCSFQDRYNTVRIAGYDEEINANYLSFTNDNGKTKYCFIESHRYVAPSTIEVIFSIDVFQTYMFDISFRECFIERAMTSNDDIGVNTIMEDFSLGDLITCERYTTKALSYKPAFILAIACENYSKFGGLYSALSYYYYDYNHCDDLNSKIQELNNAGKGDSIAYIFTFPDYFKGDTYTNGTLIGYEELQTYFENFNLSDINYFQGYKPYNNKLYCYPFSMITIKNNEGANVVLKRELLDNKNKLKVRLDCIMTPNSSVSLTPCEYAGRDESYDDGIILNDFPLCSWINDAYANWHAQNVNGLQAQSANAILSLKTSNQIANNNLDTANTLNNIGLAKNIFNTTVGGVTTMLGGNIAGGLTSLATGGVNAGLDYASNNISNQNNYNNARISSMASYQASVNTLMASVEDMKLQPNTARGNTSCNGLEIARNNANFKIDVMSIKSEYAKIIDLYYQQFGYKLNTIDTPKNYLKTRKKWNYIKTLNCSIFGRDIPFEDINTLNAIFDNGVTIWHADEYMFKYDTKNEIV